jgi:hypothetical protein
MNAFFAVEWTELENPAAFQISDMTQWDANKCRASSGLTRQKQEHPRIT